MEASTSALSPITSLFKGVGFDLHGVTSLEAYNKDVKEEFKISPKDPSTQTLWVLGNTKSFWELFVSHLQNDASWISRDNPFDDFVEHQTNLLSGDLDAHSLSHEIYFAHKCSPHWVAIQKAAQLSGLAWIAPSHLSVHNTYGPWISFRCILLLKEEVELAAQLIKEPTCLSCQRHCHPVFLEIEQLQTKVDWKEWLKLRDSCPIGKLHRFGKEQIEYHYTKDKNVLQAIISKQEPTS